MASRIHLLALTLLLPLACDGADAEGDDGAPSIGGCADREFADDPYADCVESFDPAADTTFGQEDLPDVVLGPPRAGFDVLSLGCGGSITLYFGGTPIRDGEGDDLVVYENPFGADFPEPGEIAVSENGEDWFTFPCDPLTLEGCAGVEVVDVASEAGGDRFDLAALALESPLTEVRWVRITDVSAAYWAEQDLSFCDPGQDGKGGFDLDAVANLQG